MVFKIEQNYDSFDYPSDVERIVQIAALHGVILSPQEADKAWEEHSAHSAASWFYLPEEDEDVWLELPYWARGE